MLALIGAAMTPLGAEAHAVDMTTLSQTYNPVDWSETASASVLTISRTGAAEAGDGPHNIIALGTGSVIATVTVDVSGAGGISGTPFFDTPTDYEGLTVTVGGLTTSSQYPLKQKHARIPAGPITLRLSRIGDTLSGAYESRGSFSTFFSITSPLMTGALNLDLSTNDFPPGATDTSVVTFSNLDVTAVPEPSLWVLSLAGFGLLGARLRRRPEARPA